METGLATAAKVMLRQECQQRTTRVGDRYGKHKDLLRITGEWDSVKIGG
jgi:hypothetical protein